MEKWGILSHLTNPCMKINAYCSSHNAIRWRHPELLMSRSILIVVFSLWLVYVCSAQPSDTAFVQSALSRARNVGMQVAKPQWPINTGGQYVEYTSIEGEHPYFVSQWVSGTVRYLGTSYGVMLLLDLRGDRLIIQHPLYDVKIELSPEKVGNFSFLDYRFINVNRDSIKNLPESGYHQVLADGSALLLVRHQKSIQRSIVSQKVVAIVKDTHLYYIIRNGVATPVWSKKSLLKTLDDHGDLKAALKKNKVKFGGARESGLSAAVRIYNRLTNPDNR